MRPLRIMVLAGGPDRERAVSLNSGAAVAAALREAGHEVIERDILPAELGALDEFARWPGDVIFPALHGSWGEGGGLQRILDSRGFRYVGSGAPVAELCMDKHLTKVALLQRGLPTPEFEYLCVGESITLDPPVVIKAPREGSSIDLSICRTPEQALRARAQLSQRHAKLLVERYISGKELTVSVLGAAAGAMALPPIHIVSATEYYDYQAKYHREDTQYLFEIDLASAVLAQVKQLAVKAHESLGCRHMSRVDFIVDDQGQPWILELNTIPGFTSHSLLPKAAARAGMSMVKLVDHLVELACTGQDEKRESQSKAG